MRFGRHIPIQIQTVCVDVEINRWRIKIADLQFRLDSGVIELRREISTGKLLCPIGMRCTFEVQLQLLPREIRPGQGEVAFNVIEVNARRIYIQHNGSRKLRLDH